MFGIEFARPDARYETAFKMWSKMGAYAKEWEEASLRATTKAEFIAWFEAKVEVIVFDEGIVVAFEAPREGVVVAHPFVVPSLRDKLGRVRLFLASLRDAFISLEVELHLCEETPRKLREIVAECGFRKMEDSTPPVRREATPHKAEDIVAFERWRILL